MGRLDVDRMLDELTPQQFDEWYAAYRAGLFRDQWEQAGLIAAEVHNGFGAIRKGLNDQSVTADYFTNPSDYDPTRATGNRDASKLDQASIDRAHDKGKVIYGNRSSNRQAGR